MTDMSGETIEQRRERIYRETLALEAVATERFLWWLSFTDPDIAATIPRERRRPGGRSFLGVCIVEAATAVGATLAAHAARCNPGGQVATFGPLPLDAIAPEWRNRLLTQAEADAIPEPDRDGS
jgi:hypothetical protein